MSQPQKNHPERKGIQPLEGDALMKKLMEAQETVQVVPKTREEKYAHLKESAGKDSATVESLKSAIAHQIEAESVRMAKTPIEVRIRDMKVQKLKEKLADLGRPGHA